MATRAVSPDALRVGRTYRFTAHTLVSPSDRSVGPQFVIDYKGGSGGPNTATEDSPGCRVGGDRRITDNMSWQITLKRIS